jgi:hypothetical protein
MGLLGGLFIDRPLMFDNYRRGTLYREFETLDEITIADKMVDEIIFYDQLFLLMDADPKPFADYFLTYQRLILTLWADGTDTGGPLAIEEFKAFFIKLWDDHSGTKNRKISSKSKESFLVWLSRKTKLSIEELSGMGAEIFENLFSEIESELDSIRTASIDPRFINMFCIQPVMT